MRYGYGIWSMVTLALCAVLGLASVAIASTKDIKPSGNWQVGDDCGCDGVICVESPWQFEFELDPSEATEYGGLSAVICIDIADMNSSADGPRILMNGQDLGRLFPPNAVEACDAREVRYLDIQGAVQIGTNTLVVECALMPPDFDDNDDIVVYSILLDSEGPTASTPTVWGGIKSLFR